MHINEVFTTGNKCYQVGAPLRPQGLMLHSIGTPQPSAAALARYFDQYQPGGAVGLRTRVRTGRRHDIPDAAVGDARLALRRRGQRHAHRRGDDRTGG